MKWKKKHFLFIAVRRQFCSALPEDVRVYEAVAGVIISLSVLTGGSVVQMQGTEALVRDDCAYHALT